MPDLPHLASRLIGTPLMIARPKLDVILRAVGPRLLGTGALLPLEQPAPAERNLAVTPDGIALVPVVGTLVTRLGWLDAASGLTSYPDLTAGIAAAMADPAIRAVLLEIDSPGGEVGGLFDLVETIRELKASAGKPLWAVASENSLSAAYAIASAADRLWVTRTGEIASIGVVAAHLDESGADFQAGKRWSFVHAGARKVDGNPHEPLSDRARAEIQADVDALYDGLKAELRGQIAGTGLGERLARTWRSEIYPRGGTSLTAAGLVWSNAPKLVGAFAHGSVIRSRRGLFLAIPTEAAGRLGDGRKRITPAGWERRSGLRLRFVHRRGGTSLLVADNARLNGRGRAARNEGRRGGVSFTRLAGRTTVPIFLLVPQVTLKKRLDVEGAARRGAARLPGLVLLAWRD